jgi:hypothetical protein
MSDMRFSNGKMEYRNSKGVWYEPRIHDGYYPQKATPSKHPQPKPAPATGPSMERPIWRGL